MSANISSSKEIKPISKNDVHRICSGQVVLNLATAVKELVENSVDAGATTVDVLVRDYGSELVQVSDNGCGVLPENFQALTLKHHTSKLQDFSDLLSIDTFGFRGEALSSLCALSNLSIITRHKSLPCATKLTFDGNGIISTTVQTARQVGTTVMLNNIFSSLPVRQKEFQRNLKREFSKMCQLLTAYCLVSTGIKITCVNETKKGSKSTIIATQGSKTVRENIACVYTTKQLSNLLPISEVELQQEILEELKISLEDSKIFKLEGFISSCAHGLGRASADRQFFFINSRPCEPSKIMRIVNQVYHQFNAHQSPFVFLNVIVARNCVDVNVTPDKRQIFLDNEKLLLAVIKESLLKMFQNIPSTFKMNNIPTNLNNSLNGKLSVMWNVKERKSPVNSLSESNKCSRNDTSNISQQIEETQNASIKNCERILKVEEESTNETHRVEGDRPCTGSYTELESDPSAHSEVSGDSKTDRQTSGFTLKRNLQENSEKSRMNSKQIKLDQDALSVDATPKKDVINTKLYHLFKEKLAAFKNEKKEKAVSDADNSLRPQNDLGECSQEEKEYTASDQSNGQEESASTNIEDCTCEMLDNYAESVECDSAVSTDSSSRKSVSVDFDFSNLEDSFKRWKSELIDDLEASSRTLVKFRAIIDPSRNELAEKELSREISQDLFQKMEVIGQFNLGFIISKLNSDLFIIDQHATDEKYNFETLQKTTSLINQKLVIPQKLELTAANEAILIDNLEIFNANGFEFKIDYEANPTERISLAAIPMSKSWTFGKEDIDELLFMLQDSPHTLCRPSRVRAMFASRACRKSVMIGTALNASKMKSLIAHMGEIDQPWNCPHGRPTMRHLVNLDLYR